MLRGLLHVGRRRDARRRRPTRRRQQAKDGRPRSPSGRYAVIVDEAHSSQTGETARELKAILGAGAAEDEEGEADWEDRLEPGDGSRAAGSRTSASSPSPPRPRARRWSSSAGRAPSGKPEPFHLYSMRQAIEEGFILDVLTNYTTYETYYRLLKAAEDDPKLPKKKAARALAKFMSLHPHNIEQKTEVMVEHFRAQRAAPARRAGQGDGGHLLAPARRALQAGVRALHRRERLHRHPAAGRVQRHGARPGHRARVHRAGHEHGRRHRQADQRSAAARALRLAGLPGPAGREQVPDRLRPAAAAHDVRGQAARRRAGRADALAPEPDDPRQGRAVRPRLRERRRGHLPRLQALLRQDRAAGGVRPVAARGAEARARSGAGLPLERGRGVRAGLLQAAGAPERRPTTRDMQRHLQPAVDRFKAHRRRGQARGVPRQAQRLRAGLRLPEPDHPLRRSPIWRCSTATDASCCRICRSTATRRSSSSATRWRCSTTGWSGSSRARSMLKEGEAAVRQEPDRGRHRQGEGREGAAVRDHRGAQRALRHAVHRRGPALLPADQGEGLQETSRSSRRRWPTRSTSSSWASASSSRT